MKKLMIIFVLGSFFFSQVLANPKISKEPDAEITKAWPNFQTVVDIGSKIIKSYPQYIIDSYEKKGEELIQLKRYQEAIECFHLAKKYQYEMAKPTTLREFELEFLGVRGDWQNMITICDDAIKLYPNHTLFYREKGRALTHLKRHQEAIECFDLAIKYHQAPLEQVCMGKLYFLKAQCLDALGSLEAALKNYNLAIEHGYDDRWVYFAIDKVKLKFDLVGKE